MTERTESPPFVYTKVRAYAFNDIEIVLWILVELQFPNKMAQA